MEDSKKKKITMPAIELRGNDKQVTRMFDLEMQLVHKINRDKSSEADIKE